MPPLACHLGAYSSAARTDVLIEDSDAHEYVADKADYVRLDDELPARTGDWT